MLPAFWSVLEGSIDETIGAEKAVEGHVDESLVTKSGALRYGSIFTRQFAMEEEKHEFYAGRTEKDKSMYLG